MPNALRLPTPKEGNATELERNKKKSSQRLQVDPDPHPYQRAMPRTFRRYGEYKGVELHAVREGSLDFLFLPSMYGGELRFPKPALKKSY